MIVGVVLAAGTSSRLGRPKQLLEVDGRPLVQHAVDAVAGLDAVVVVLGHAATEVEAAVELPVNGRTVLNPAYAEGQSTSLRAGLAASAGGRAALVVVSDQPGVTDAHVGAIVQAYEDTHAKVVRATYGGVPGHPVLLDASTWDAVAAATGDRGARDVLRDHPEWVLEVPLGDAPPPDVDTEDDYRRLLGR